MRKQTLSSQTGEAAAQVIGSTSNARVQSLEICSCFENRGNDGRRHLVPTEHNGAHLECPLPFERGVLMRFIARLLYSCLGFRFKKWLRPFFVHVLRLPKADVSRRGLVSRNSCFCAIIFLRCETLRSTQPSPVPAHTRNCASCPSHIRYLKAEPPEDTFIGEVQFSKRERAMTVGSKFW